MIHTEPDPAFTQKIPKFKQTKKSGHRQNVELCPKLPKCSSPPPKFDIDNKDRFRYQIVYRFRLIEASICGTTAEAVKQFSFRFVRFGKATSYI
jgi:hypothetical protein